MMQLSAFGDLRKPATAVGFAGFGGSCEGIRRALGVSPIVAINHDEHAIALHKRNHPETLHFREDIWAVDPRQACRGRKLQLLWLSPDCTHHSRAKGAAPRESHRRSLADVVFKWVDSVQPRIIMLENVPEWLDWGPVDDAGQVIVSRKGELFRAWVSRLKSHGYRVEWRFLRACDYGVPTSRERVYLIARCDEQPIVWPAPTHGKGLIPYRTAAECVDWSIPSLSIFATPDEARAWARQHSMGIPRRPLEPATLRRIAAGLVRYVLHDDHPYHAADSASYLIQTGYGERIGQTPRALDIQQPLGTVVACGQKHALISAWIAKHYGGVVGHTMSRPLGTITTADHHSLCTATLSTSDTASARKVSAFLCAYYGSEKDGQSIKSPLRAVTCTDRFGLVTVTLEGQPYTIVDISMRMLQPRELARAMGFPDTYILSGTKREQVARIGNAVCPQVAEALVRANVETQK